LTLIICNRQSKTHLKRNDLKQYIRHFQYFRRSSKLLHLHSLTWVTLLSPFRTEVQSITAHTVGLGGRLGVSPFQRDKKSREMHLKRPKIDKKCNIPGSSPTMGMM
jgi:hypothetical protein